MTLVNKKYKSRAYTNTNYRRDLEKKTKWGAVQSWVEKLAWDELMLQESLQV